MKAIHSITAALLLMCTGASAQVTAPEWLYGQILQKKLPDPSSKKGRTIASEKIDRNSFNIREENGWRIVENKPTAAVKTRVFLLPGFLGTDYVYHDLLRDSDMESRGYQLMAGNPPGFDGLKVPGGFDFSIHAYAELVEQMAAQQRADVLVGHSYMATVLGEVATRGKFHGKIVMISPALEPDDEPISTRVLDLTTRSDGYIKDVAWAGMYKYLEAGFADFFSKGDDEHIEIAAEEARKTPIPYGQKMLVQYFNYLRGEKTFLNSASKSFDVIHYVSGEKDIVGLKDENKAALEKQGVKFHHLKKASHMLMIDEPKKLNDLLRSLTP